MNSIGYQDPGQDQRCTDSEIFLFGQRTTDNGQTFFSTDNGHRTTDKNFFRRTTDTDNGQPKIDGQRTKFFEIDEFFL
ncbi:hypothetical protein B9Z55_000372 [Caenorhabditis nigoni]|uniref:Uncharacterized protein n=1 Tax=Caenorhabditis nigoni TaxID=1611254 RepID=A0A2G5VSD0_9PELO|nr:hypothetical protein B9Z55_000372 [Caenorhabditis nigoni]